MALIYDMPDEDNDDNDYSLMIICAVCWMEDATYFRYIHYMLKLVYGTK